MKKKSRSHCKKSVESESLNCIVSQSDNGHSIACRCMLYMIFRLHLLCHSLQNILTRDTDGA
jgi:hypothetical protein